MEGRILRQIYHNDHLGSVRAITNRSGSIITAIDYYPFGEQLQLTGTSSRFSFNGKEYDDSYGFDLYYCGARYMSPSLGRFVTPDPVKSFLNPYSYVNNNPINMVDPLGLIGGPPPNSYIPGMDMGTGDDRNRIPMALQLNELREGNIFNLCVTSEMIKLRRILINAYKNACTKAMKTGDQGDIRIAFRLRGLILCWDFQTKVSENLVIDDIDVVAEMKDQMLIVNASTLENNSSEYLEATIIHEIAHKAGKEIYGWDLYAGHYNAAFPLNNDIARSEAFAFIKEFEYYDQFNMWAKGFYGPGRENDYFELQHISDWRSYKDPLDSEFWRNFLNPYFELWEGQYWRVTDPLWYHYYYGGK